MHYGSRNFVSNEVSHMVTHSRPAPFGFSCFQNFYVITYCVQCSTIQSLMRWVIDFLPHTFSPKGFFLVDRFFLASV